MVEDGDLGIIGRDVSVELLLVEIPLDRVQVVPLEVVVAPEDSLVAFQCVRRDDGVFQKFDAISICKKNNYKG